MTSEPRTAEGRLLAALWPLTSTEQTCCAYPHGERSADSDVFPAHDRTTLTTTRSALVTAVEDEARSLALSEVEAAVTGLDDAHLHDADTALRPTGDCDVCDAFDAVLAAIAALREGTCQ